LVLAMPPPVCSGGLTASGTFLTLSMTVCPTCPRRPRRVSHVEDVHGLLPYRRHVGPRHRQAVLPEHPRHVRQQPHPVPPAELEGEPLQCKQFSSGLSLRNNNSSKKAETEFCCCMPTSDTLLEIAASRHLITLTASSFSSVRPSLRRMYSS
jgi:hypothetical protein